MLKERTASHHVSVGLGTVNINREPPCHLACRRIQSLAVLFERGEVLNESNTYVFLTACPRMCGV
jgi:hypothetical protein